MSRDKSIDIVRGVAIFLVLWGHIIQGFSQRDDFFSNWLVLFIYSFHMPLFMTLSGYLFCGTAKRNFIDIIKSKLLSIILPFVVWNLLLYLRQCIFSYITQHSCIFEIFDLFSFGIVVSELFIYNYLAYDICFKEMWFF